MKITGKVMVSKLMFQMGYNEETKKGEKGFLTHTAITLAEKEIYINTKGTFSPTKNEDHVIPIERIGKGKDDFAIDMNLPLNFYNKILDAEQKDALAKDPYIIGPFAIETELYDENDYRKQTYPRMDMAQLIGTFAAVNEQIAINGDSEYLNKHLVEDRKALKRLIKEKLLQEKEIDNLKLYEKQFSPFNEEEESKNEGFPNYIADEEILNGIRTLIEEYEKGHEERKALEIMGIPELKKEMKKAKEEEDYQKMAHIRDLIIEKGGTCPVE